jgi:hypothetical protein
MIYNFNNFVQLVTEGLIKTYDLYKTIDGTNDLLKTYNIKFEIIKKNNTFSIKIFNANMTPNVIDIIEIFLSSIFNLYGWFPSKMDMENIYGMKNSKKFDKDELYMYIKNLLSIEITFESKFDIKVTDIPEKLYHITIQHYEEIILKNGIYPKYKSKLTTHDYDGRIYLCDSILKCKSLISRMNLFYKEEMYDILHDIRNPKKYYNKNTKWTLFEINTEKAKIDKLYIDPNFLGGYYYLNNIPNNALQIIEREN